MTRTGTATRPPLIDRARELHDLDRAWKSGRPEMLIATGRRRAGKSFLLARYLEERRGFYYQATRTTSREQLGAIYEAALAALPKAGLAHGAGFRDWDAFFRFIAQQAGGRPFLLVLDELPYLLDAVRGFGTILQKHWDHTFPRTKVKLVLTGSYVSAMRRLTTADEPLHGRRTGRLAIEPFGYADAAAFVPGYGPADRLRAWAIFGGLPGQLVLLDPRAPLHENVARHILDPGGRLADEAEHLFDAFLQEAGVHYSIVHAIAQGEHKWSKITNRVGKQSASLSRPLQWLLDMDVIERILPISEPGDGNPKRAVYRLTDPYLSFWHRFVAPLRAGGAVGLARPADLWRRHVAPHMDDYMGRWFERACRTFVGAAAHPRLPFRPDRVGEWWSEDSRVEVDVVALGGRGEILLGECKWGHAVAADLERLERRRDALVRELGGVRRVHLAIFAGRPINDRRLRQRITAGDALHFSLADLFARGPVRRWSFARASHP